MDDYSVLRKRYPNLPLQLKEEQEKAIKSIMEGKHILAVLPTGFGKSIIYTVPSLLQEEKLTIIVTPLKALMASQVKALRLNGIPAVAVMCSAEMSQEDRSRKSHTNSVYK